MYNSFFGLQSNPFGMTPNPGCLLWTAQHREAFAGLTYTILNRRGFGVLTGDAGTGKTTLVAKVLASMAKGKVQTSIVFHPTLSSSDFLELLMLDFGITDIPDSKAQRLVRLHNFLLENHHAGRISTLIVDEAHKLSPRLLEEVRLLGNFDYTDQKLLQIVLVGQPELDDLLERDELWQLKQRVAVRMRIRPLLEPDIVSYILYRWRSAGGKEPLPFSPSAITEIKRLSGGYPRVINALCDNALLLAFAEGSSAVDASQVVQGAADLKLTGTHPVTSHTTAAHPAAPPAPVHAAVTHEPQPAAEPVEVRHEAAQAAVAAATTAAVPSPIRIPEFAAQQVRPSLWTRWIGRFGNGNI